MNGEAPPMRTSIPVREPDGSVAPVPDGEPAPAAPPAPAVTAPSVDPLDAAVDSVVHDSKPQPAAAAPVPADPLDAAVDSVVQDDAKRTAQEKSFAAFQATHQQTDPAKRLEVLKYAIAGDLDPQTVESQFDQVKKSVDLHQLDQRLQAAPGLAKFLADAAQSPVAKDDAANLSAMEWGLTGKWENGHLVTGPAPLRALRDALRQQDYIALANKQASGLTLSDTEQAELQDLETKYGGDKDYGADHLWSKAYVGLFKLGPYLGGDIVARAAGGFAGATAAAATGAGGGAAVGAAGAGVGAAPGAAVGAAGGAVAGAGVGQALGSTVWNYYQNFGPQYRQLKRLTDADGKPLLNDNEARGYAELASLVSAGLMSGATGYVLKKIPAVNQLLGKLGGDIITKALAKSTVYRTLALAPVKLGATAAAGGLGMAGMAAANVGSEELAKLSAGQDADLGRVTGAAKQAFMQGLVDMAGLTLFAGGHEFLHDLGRARLLEQHTARFQAEVDAAEKSNLLQLDPGLFEQAHRLAQGDAPQARYVEREAWDRYWQQKQVDPGQMAARVFGDGGKAYAEASATGGDLAIPAEKFMSSFANTEHLAGLKDDLRFTPDGVSLNQARTALEGQAKEAAGAPEDSTDTAKQVAEEWTRKAVDAGQDPKVAQATGQLVGAAFRNLGKHMGMDAFSAYRELAQVRILQGEGKPAEDTSFGFGANAAESDARAAAERMSPENKASALAFIDYATGKADKRPAITPELEKQLARFGVADPKGFAFDEQGRSLERGLGGRRVRGAQPEEFRRQRAAQLEHDTGEAQSYRQDEVALAENHNLQPLREAYSKLTPEERARALHLDRVTGLREADVFDSAPVPEGKVAAVITTPAVKGINDHETAGGHDVANALLATMARALSKDHPEAARGGTNFRVLLDSGKAEEQLKQVLSRVQRAVGPDLDVLGAHGKTADEAFAKLKEDTDKARAAGTLPQRGQLRRGVDVEKLAFSDKQVNAKPPMELVHKMAGTPESEAFQRTYLDTIKVGDKPVPTGLLTGRGFYATPPKAHTIAFDMRGLGKVPRLVGDNMLVAFARALRMAGGDHVDAAHLSGDEFAAKHDDPVVLRRFAERVGEIAKDFSIDYIDPATGKEMSADVGYRHGIGTDYAGADRDLNVRRRREEAAAANPGGADGQVLPGGAGEDALGPELQRQADLALGGAAVDAGADGQGAPGEGAGVSGGGQGRRLGGVDRLPQGDVASPMEPGPLWFSQAEKAAEGAKQEKGDATSWLSVISKSAGVKKEELDYMGLPEWLAQQKGSISKQQVLDYIRAHRVDVEERSLGGGLSVDDPRRTAAGWAQRYGSVEDARDELRREAAAHRRRASIDQNVTLDGLGALAWPNKSHERSLLFSLERAIHAKADGFNLKETLHELVDDYEKSAEQLADGGEVEPGVVEKFRAAADLARAAESRITLEPSRASRESLAKADKFEEAAKFLDTKTNTNVADLVDQLPLEGSTQYASYRTKGETPGSYRELLFHSPDAKEFKAPHFGGDLAKGLLAHARFSEHTLADGKKVLLVDELQSDLHQHGRAEGYADTAKEDALRAQRAEVLNEAAKLFKNYPPDNRPPEAAARIQQLQDEADRIDARLNEVLNSNDGKPPVAPFKNSWEEMVAKRMLRWAAEHGYEKMAWTTGATQSKRYELASHVDRLVYDPATKHIFGYKDGEQVVSEPAPPERLPEFVGADVAKRLLERTPTPGWAVRERRGRWEVIDHAGNPYSVHDSEEAAQRDAAASNADETSRVHVLSGIDLEMGGGGMRAAYDVRLPSVVNKLVKKYGGKVGNEKLSTGDTVHTVAIPEAMRKEVVSRGFPLFQPPEGGGEFRLSAKGRGFIEFRPAEGGEPRQFDIHLLANADQSTLAHETFHFLSEAMGDVATRQDAPEQLKQDYQTLLSFMGHASHEERLASAEERRTLSAKEGRTAAEDTRLTELTGKEEKATHAWEQYLAEGKPPSAELAGAFTRFRRWMARIYRGLMGPAQQFERQYGQPLNLSDDVRRVFDRLLASEDEVRRAEAATAAAEPFPKVLDSLTPEQRVEYMRAAVDAREAAQDELVRRIAEAQRSENSKFMRGERERIQGDVEKELDARPAYRALRFLQDGDTPESPGEAPWLLKDGDGAPMRLDRKAVEKAMGKDFSQALPKGVFAPKGKGVDADILAARLGGWEDGKALLEALAATTPRREAITKETQARMESLYGPDLLDNPQRLSELAMGAVHNEAQARKAFIELEALRKQLKTGAPPADALTPEIARQQAQRLVAEKTVGELTGGEQGLAGRYLRAERTAARRSLQAMEAGNVAKAYGEKQAQILNMHLYREASVQRDATEKAGDVVRQAAQPSWRAALGKAGPDLRDATDAILLAVGARRLAPGQDKPGLEAFLGSAAPGDVGFDADSLRQLLSAPKAWSDLTPGEALDVRDALRNIKHLANQRTEVVVDGKREAKANLFADMAERVSKRPAQPQRPRDAALESKLGDARRIVQMLDAQLLTPDSLLSMLDGAEKDGPFRRALEGPLLEARAHKRELTRDFVAKVVKAWETLPKELRTGKSEVIDVTQDLPLPPDLKATLGDGPVTRSYLWMMALNLGNEGNKQRLLDGYGWTEDQVLKTLDKHLSKPEWDFVQKTWDTLESMYPLVADVHEKVTGLRPDKVVATPVQTKWGTYPGGYFPAREEPRAKTGRVHQTPDSIADIFGEEYRRPAVATGHTKQRAGRADYYVNLQWNVVPAHMSQVVHDIAYRGAIRQTAGLVLDPRFRDLSERYLGTERSKQFVPWLQAVANQQADSVPGNLHGVQRVYNWAQGRQLRMALGGNLASMAKHTLDPFVAMAGGVTKPADTAMAYAKGMTGLGFASMRKFALEHSQELQLRSDHVTRELERQLREIGEARPGAVLRGLKATAHGAYEVMGVLHDVMDRFVTTTTWTAAYTGERREALKAGMGDNDAHAQAVRQADAAVRKLYPSTDIAQQSSVIRRKDFLGTAMAAFSFANKVWNLRRQLFDNAWVQVHSDEGGFTSKAGAVAKVAGAFLVAFPILGAATQYLSGRRPEEDETQDEWLTRTMLADNFNDTPLLGPLAESGAQLAVTGKAKAPQFHDQPAVALLNELWKKVQDAKKSGDLTEEQKLERQLETVLSLSMAGSGATQIHRTLDYGRQLYTGEAQPRGPGDVLGGLIYGRTTKKPGNPLTDLQDAASE